MASTQISHRGSYEHYKTRTKVFINWLTEAARKCCKLEDVVAALRGRAGKRAKQNDQEILLTTSEIISLCLKIAGKNKVMIPDWILRLLNTIIAKRTEYAALYSALSAAEGSAFERSNAGHAHFIDVLQQAHDIFAALDEARIARRNKLVKKKSPFKSLSNMFEHLEVEDGPGVQMGGSEVEVAAAAAAAEAAEAELEEEELEQRAADPQRIQFKVKVDDEEEILVQLTHLLSDFKALREEIEDTFKEYICGDVTHEVACTVASTGFGLIRRTCERFTDQHPEFGDYAYMLKFLGLRMERHNGSVTIHPEGKDEQDTQSPGMDASTTRKTKLVVPSLTQTSVLCASGADIILQLNDELQSPKRVRKPGGHPLQRHGFAQLLHDGIPEFRSLKKHPEVLVPEFGSWYGDEFLSGILNYAYGNQQGLPIWLAVITQCYREIYDLLDGMMEVGAAPDSNRWLRIKDMMDSAMDFEYCKGEDLDTQNKREWSKWFEWLRSRDTGPEGNKVCVIASGLQDVAAPTYLITKLPTVTSEMSFLPTIMIYVDGCDIANTNAVIHCAAHLYSACHHTGLISPEVRWADMDFFLERHSMYTKTQPGADNYSMLNRFLLDLGVRGTTLANIRTKPKQADIKNIRRIVPSSKLVSNLGEQWKNASDRGKKMMDVSMMDAILEALADCSNSKPGSRSSKRKGKVYTPVELLSAFKEHLIVDEPERNFNMIAFSQQCSIVVAEARKQTSGTSIAVSSTASPHKVTASILADSARALDQDLPASSTLLSLVAYIIERTIACCGDVLSKEAYGMSSGHLSADQKPQLSGGVS